MRTAFVNGAAGSLEELLGADDPTLGRDQHLEHGELLAGERDVLPVAEHLATERVEPESRDLVNGRPAVRPATIERAQPKHQLAQLERLGDVVVGAETEAGGLVVKAIRGG